MSKESKDRNCSSLLFEANNDLAVRLHKKFAEEKGNVFFSPFSISLAMCMLLRGTRAQTAVQMRKVLGFDVANLLTEDVHKCAERLLQEFSEVRDSYTLAVANAVVSQKNFPLLPSYRSDLKENYHALAIEVDFQKDSGSAVAQINEWVKVNTRGLISKIFDELNPATVLVLLNAVYFKGLWLHQFDSERTQLMPFYNQGSKEEAKDVPMMVISEEFYFVENDKFKALQLPYKGCDIAMILVLPLENTGLDKLEEELQPHAIAEIRKTMLKSDVDVFLPKLHLEYSKSLVRVFEELGLDSIFRPGGDFSGITEADNLVVSEIVHKAVLDVNEEGSEAAAVTGIVMVECCMLSQKRSFRADHPFLLFISDTKKELILFMGRVEKM